MQSKGESRERAYSGIIELDRQHRFDLKRDGGNLGVHN